VEEAESRTCQRHSVLKMCPAHFDNKFELSALGLQRIGQRMQRGQQPVLCILSPTAPLVKSRGVVQPVYACARVCRMDDILSRWRMSRSRSPTLPSHD